MSPAEAQRREALEHANQTRSKRARLKQGLRTGEDELWFWIEEPPSWLAGMRVSELVCALPGYGAPKTSRLLRQCGVPWEKRVGSLTQRQRDAILRALA